MQVYLLAVWWRLLLLLLFWTLRPELDVLMFSFVENCRAHYSTARLEHRVCRAWRTVADRSHNPIATTVFRRHLRHVSCHVLDRRHLHSVRSACQARQQVRDTACLALTALKDLLCISNVTVSQKVSPLIITLANANRFSKFFHQLIRILCILDKDFYLTCNMLLYYLVKFENSKTLPNFYVEHDN